MYCMSSGLLFDCLFIDLFIFPSGDSGSGGTLPAALQTQPVALLRACWEHRTGAQEEEWS